MHIKITGFKIHLDAEYIFENNKMTLIKGQSGHGKSTILQAIFWAMYGNMRSIYNNMRITKNLSVTLTLPGIVICRRKNPDLLTVTINVIENGKIAEKQYLDTVGQNIIDKRFGNREVWRACSYIQQQTMCSLLTGTSKDRMAILNALSFSNENPREYIDKINDKYKEVKLEFEKSQAVLNNEIETFSKELTANPVKYNPKEGDLDLAKVKISDWEKKISEIKERLSVKQNYLANINYIKDVIKSLELQLTSHRKSYNEKYEGKTFKTFKPYIPLPKPISKPLLLEKKFDESLFSYLLPKIQREQYEGEIERLKLELEKLSKQIEDSQKEWDTQILSIDGKIAELYTETPSPLLDLNEIISNSQYFSVKNTANKKMESLKIYNETLSKKENELNMLNFITVEAYEEIVRDINILNEQYIWNLEREETEREKNKLLAQSLALEYDELIIGEAIKNYSYQLDFYLKLEKLIPNFVSLIEVEKQIENIKNVKNIENGEIKNIKNTENINDLETLLRDKASYISELKKGLEILQCPNCKIALKYKDGNLLSENIKPSTKEDIQREEKEYSNISLQLQNKRKEKSLIENYENIKQKLETLLSSSGITFSQLEDFYKNLANYSSFINDTRTYINNMSQIKFYKLQKYNSTILKEVLKYKNNKIRKENLEKEKAEILLQIKSLQKDIESLDIEKIEILHLQEEDRLKRNNDMTSKWQSLERERLGKITELEREKKKITDSKDNLRKNREEIYRKIESQKKNIDLENEKVEAYKKRIDLEKKNTDLENLRIKAENDKIKTNNEKEIKEYEEKEVGNMMAWEKEKNNYEFSKEMMIKDIEGLERRIAEENQKIKEIMEKIDNNIEIELKNGETELEKEKQKVLDIQYAEKMIARERDLSQKREKFMEIYNDLIALDQLKSTAINVECKQLEDTVDSINLMLENTLSIFFPDPITFKLCLYKQLKKKGGGTKPGLNIEITYKGCKHENINNLSGGEVSRISLALLLALNFVSNSPMILLDECVASLDGDLKENCITGIKAIPNKTIICIDHDESMEGFYDAVISL